MDHDLTQIHSLILLHLEGGLSPSDRLQLDKWMNAHPANRQLFEDLTSEVMLQKQLNELHGVAVDAALERFKAGEYATKSASVPVHRIHFLRKWGWAAASVILCLSIGAYFWTTNKKNAPKVTVAQKTREIAPGKNGAILTLADGSQMVLDSMGNGVIASQNGTQIVLKNGQLTYDPSEKITGEMVFNTMTTPKGRQFHVTLPDGTQVWLNSASSIRYPTMFAGNERKVEVTGEAYFEVAKNAQKSFRVNANNKADVVVLGTHFNVNAYKNEDAIKTTLLEGSVSVNGTTIRPGQQAEVTERVRVVSNTDLDKVMAWKNGLFNFDGATLYEIFRQVERWYDIEVVYEKGVPDKVFEGKMTRDVPLNELLFVLEKLGIHARLEGRKLFIMP